MVIWSLGLILMLFFAGGLALDLWRVLSWHGTLAGIADKAALAAANELAEHALFYNRLELNRSEAERTAKEFARRQLDQPEWNNASMTVEIEFKGRREVQVKVRGEVQLTLLRMFAPPQGITLTATGRAYPCVVRPDRGFTISWQDCR